MLSIYLLSSCSTHVFSSRSCLRLPLCLPDFRSSEHLLCSFISFNAELQQINTLRVSDSLPASTECLLTYLHTHASWYTPFTQLLLQRYLCLETSTMHWQDVRRRWYQRFRKKLHSRSDSVDLVGRCEVKPPDDHVDGPVERLDSVSDDVAYSRMGAAGGRIRRPVNSISWNSNVTKRNTYAEKTMRPLPLTSIAAYRSSMMCCADGIR